MYIVPFKIGSQVIDTFQNREPSDRNKTINATTNILKQPT